MNRSLIDYNPETEVFETTAPQVAVNGSTERAIELLNSRSESQLDRFLQKLLHGTKRDAGALKGILRTAAHHALPKADPFANQFFGLELEGLSPEDQELEIAKGFVRFADEAIRYAAQSPARIAAAQAAKQFAPGLLRELLLEFRNHEERIMHDIDRTQLELDSEGRRYETEELEYERFGATESEEEQEGEEEEEEEFYGEMLSEAEELELATELLSVQNEEELDQFLGGIISGLTKGVGKVIRSPLGKALGGHLKGLAKKLVPIAGGALGGFVGGPIGAKIGSGLASAAGSALGLEAETLEGEDAEFEGAKQFARLAAETVQKAVTAPGDADPKAVARAALLSSVKKYAPGLLSGAQSTASGALGQRSRHGRWMRRGNSIVLFGV